MFFLVLVYVEIGITCILRLSANYTDSGCLLVIVTDELKIFKFKRALKLFIEASMRLRFTKSSIASYVQKLKSQSFHRM